MDSNGSNLKKENGRQHTSHSGSFNIIEAGKGELSVIGNMRIKGIFGGKLNVTGLYGLGKNNAPGKLLCFNPVWLDSAVVAVDEFGHAGILATECHVFVVVVV